MSDIVLCNECNNQIKLPKLKRTVHQGLAYEFYWHCPECNHKYISYYTDQKIRRDIKRQEKRYKKLNQQILLKENESVIRKLQAEINMNDKLIKKDMDALYERIQKELV